MKRKRIYISIPISGHDLEEVKAKARKAREWVLWDGFGLGKGWQNSKGYMAEFEVARIYGKEIIME